MKLKPKNKCRQLQNLSSVYKTKKTPKNNKHLNLAHYEKTLKLPLQVSTILHIRNRKIKIEFKSCLKSLWVIDVFFFSPSGLPKFWLKLCGRSKNIHQEVHFTTRNRYYTTLGEIFSKYLLITHVKIYAFFVQNLYIFH